MATYNEQVVSLWEEWEKETGDESGNPDEFVEWAMANNKLAFPLQDVRSALRKRVTAALRQDHRINENGVSYRAKQCVTLFEDGVTFKRWFDTDTGGTSNLRQKALRERRDAIANDVYRAMNDKEHMNWKFPDDPQLNFLTDFTDDYEEMKAAKSMREDVEDAA